MLPPINRKQVGLFWKHADIILIHWQICFTFLKKTRLLGLNSKQQCLHKMIYFAVCPEWSPLQTTPPAWNRLRPNVHFTQLFCWCHWYRQHPNELIVNTLHFYFIQSSQPLPLSSSRKLNLQLCNLNESWKTSCNIPHGLFNHDVFQSVCVCAYKYSPWELSVQLCLWLMNRA